MDINELAEKLLKVTLATVGRKKRINIHVMSFQDELTLRVHFIRQTEGIKSIKCVDNLMIYEGELFERKLRELKKLIKSHCDIDPQTFGL